MLQVGLVTLRGHASERQSGFLQALVVYADAEWSKNNKNKNKKIEITTRRVCTKKKCIFRNRR